MSEWNREHLEKFRELGFDPFPIGQDKQPYKGYRWSSKPLKPHQWGTGEAGFAFAVPEDIVVIDLDITATDDQKNPLPPEQWRKDAEERFKKKFKIESIPDIGPCVRTASGGWHIYYRRGDHHIENRKGTTGLGPKVDVQADGAYCVGPGSICRVKHLEQTAEYIAMGDFTKIPVIPDEVAAAAIAHEKGSGFSGDDEEAFSPSEGGGVGEGSRNDTLSRALWKVFHQFELDRASLSRWVIAANGAWNAPPLPREELLTMFNHVWNQSASARTSIWMGGVWQAGCESLLTKKLRKGLSRMGFDVRFNKRSAEYERNIGENEDGDPVWEPMKNNEILRWQLRANEEIIMGGEPYLNNDGKPKIGKFFTRNWTDKDWDKVCSKLVEGREIDPFIEDFLDKLPEWDGEKRLDEMFSLFFKTRESEKVMLKYAARSLMMGMLKRAYEPGCKHDEMVVLIGPEGCFKSTFCQYLLPPDKPEWFVDGFDFNLDAKEGVEKRQGAVVVEVTEMENIGKAGLPKIKSMLARCFEKVRLAFRRNPESYPCYAIYIGTSNNKRVLPHDPKGNRRFIPVYMEALFLERDKFIETMMANMPQIFAEAKVMYGEGERAVMDDEIKQAHAVSAKRYSFNPDLEDEILFYLDEPHESRVVPSLGKEEHPIVWYDQMREDLNIPDRMSTKHLVRLIKDIWAEGNSKILIPKESHRVSAYARKHFIVLTRDGKVNKPFQRSLPLQGEEPPPHEGDNVPF